MARFPPPTTIAKKNLIKFIYQLSWLLKWKQKTTQKEQLQEKGFFHVCLFIYQSLCL